ncbi:MAG TPA: hypothetical protein VF702_02535 [Allosphingosinicella sp.]|jgi:hypothetical protein
MLFRAIAFAAFALSACGDASEASAGQGDDPRSAAAWTIGPIISGRNYSVNMPLNPAARRGGGWQIDLPRAPGSVHYVTFRHGSLAGKRRIVMRGRIEADAGVRILPSTNPQLPSMMTLYFQRSGDNWRGRGRYETYRWYATFATRSPVAPGTFEIVAPLDGAWTAVGASSARSNPAAFRDALTHADQVGFVLGGGDGYGHGVFATGRARLIVTDFRVE